MGWEEGGRWGWETGWEVAKTLPIQDYKAKQALNYLAGVNKCHKTLQMADTYCRNDGVNFLN